MDVTCISKLIHNSIMSHSFFFGRVKAFAVMKNSAAYWQGKASNHTLQRVYGVTFPDSKELKQHLFRYVCV